MKTFTSDSVAEGYEFGSERERGGRYKASRNSFDKWIKESLEERAKDRAKLGMERSGWGKFEEEIRVPQQLFGLNSFLSYGKFEPEILTL